MRVPIASVLLLAALPLLADEPLKIRVGDTAPDFTLLQYDGQSVKPVSLHDYKGKKQIALAFYVFAFTGG